MREFEGYVDAGRDALTSENLYGISLVTSGSDTATLRAFGAVWNELLDASKAFQRFASAHEGAAVIREEHDEFWDEIKANKRPGARARQRAEAVQLAAMAIRFLVDCPPEDVEV